MGVIRFLQGDGRFGILEMLKHRPPVVIDLAQPWVRRLLGWALGYCLLGFAAAVARTTTEFSLVAMLGARAEIYIFLMENTGAKPHRMKPRTLSHLSEFSTIQC
jgi:hypothetical protein